MLLALVLGAFLFLFFLPADYFDSGQSMCVSIWLFDLECFGCGLTRGIMHMMHFEFQEAWDFNKLSFLIMPIGLFLWIHLFGILIGKSYFSFEFKRSFHITLLSAA